MIRKIQMMAVILVLLIAFSACSSSEPSIVGKWYSEQDKTSMEINENGTFELIDETIEDSHLLTGTYRIDGDKFLFTPLNETEYANNFKLTKDTLVLTYGEYSSTFKRVEK